MFTSSLVLTAGSANTFGVQALRMSSSAIAACFYAGTVIRGTRIEDLKTTPTHRVVHGAGPEHAVCVIQPDGFAPGVPANLLAISTWHTLYLPRPLRDAVLKPINEWSAACCQESKVYMSDHPCKLCPEACPEGCLKDDYVPVLAADLMEHPGRVAVHVVTEGTERWHVITEPELGGLLQIDDVVWSETFRTPFTEAAMQGWATIH